MTRGLPKYLKDFLIRILERGKASSDSFEEQLWETISERLAADKKKFPFFMKASKFTPTSISYLPYNVVSFDEKGNFYLHLLEPLSLSHPEKELTLEERRQIVTSLQGFFDTLLIFNLLNFSKIFQTLHERIRRGEPSKLIFLFGQR